MSDMNSSQPQFGGQPIWVWIGAAVVVVLILGGGSWWLWGGSHKTETPAAATTASADSSNLSAGLQDIDTPAPSMSEICTATLNRALAFGVLPPGATLSGNDAQASQPDGFYTCSAQASDGKYTLSFDMNCHATHEKNCFALDSVKRDDGTTLYQRQG